MIPIDRNNFAYAIIFWLGVGHLFPWNTIITASEYFATRFCETSFSNNFMNYLSFTSTLSQTIGLAISVKYPSIFSMRNKIIYPLLCYSAVFLLTTIFVTLNINPSLLFWVTLMLTFVCGVCGAILSGGLFGLAAMFPPSYTGAVMTGNGIAGLVASLSAIVTTLGQSDSTCTDDDSSSCDNFRIDYSALAYFLISALILISCIIGYLLLEQLTFTKYYLSALQLIDCDEKPDDDILQKKLLKQKEDSTSYQPIYNVEELVRNDNIPINSPMHDDKEQSNDEEFENLQMTNSNEISLENIFKTLNIIVAPAICVWLTFTITIGLFPALTVFIESKEKCNTSQRFYNDIFTPFLFLIFNLFDFFGRGLAGVNGCMIFNQHNIWLPTLSRLIFFPLFLLCNISDSKLPVLFTNDAFPIIFMSLFAFTNGYVASCCMIIGPTIVSEKDAFLTGTMMVFFLTSGLLFGACLSFLTVFISQGAI